MALIPYVKDEVFQKVLGTQQTANLLRILFHSPIWAKQFVRLASVQMTELSLHPVLRELIILQTSRLFDSEYVWEQHRGISEAMGVSEDQRKALDLGHLASSAFSERERVLLEFISHIPTTRPLSSKQFAKLREFFSEQAIVEIIGVHGFAYTVSALTSILSVEVDPVSGPDMLSFVDEVGRSAR